MRGHRMIQKPPVTHEDFSQEYLESKTSMHYDAIVYQRLEEGYFDFSISRYNNSWYNNVSMAKYAWRVIKIHRPKVDHVFSHIKNPPLFDARNQPYDNDVVMWYEITKRKLNQ